MTIDYRHNMTRGKTRYSGAATRTWHRYSAITGTSAAALPPLLLVLALRLPVLLPALAPLLPFLPPLPVLAPF